jgi:hypothetical protein
VTTGSLGDHNFYNQLQWWNSQLAKHKPSLR